MKVIAIDPGFEKVGIAILDRKDGKECLLFSECFQTDAKKPFYERLLLIKKRIETLISEEKPEVMAIETLFFNTNQKTALRVAEARGIIACTAMDLSVPVFEYTPLQIKIAITGYGRAPKDQIYLMVKKLLPFNKNIEHDDEVDAMAIGLTHLAVNKS